MLKNVGGGGEGKGRLWFPLAPNVLLALFITFFFHNQDSEAFFL